MPVAQSGWVPPVVENALARAQKLAAVKNVVHGGRITRGGSVKIGPLRKGELMGYQLSQNAATRRKHLLTSLGNRGYTPINLKSEVRQVKNIVIKELTALKTFNKNNQTKRNKIDADMKWVRRLPAGR